MPESPDWLARQKADKQHANTKAHLGLLAIIKGNAALCVFAVVLMAAFNFMSHGSQDLYPKVFFGAGTACAAYIHYNHCGAV